MSDYWHYLLIYTAIVIGLLALKLIPWEGGYVAWPDNWTEDHWKRIVLGCGIIAIIIAIFLLLPMVLDIPSAISGRYTTITGMNTNITTWSSRNSSIIGANTIRINGESYNFPGNNSFDFTGIYKIEFLPHCKYGISATEISKPDPAHPVLPMPGGLIFKGGSSYEWHK